MRYAVAAFTTVMALATAHAADLYLFDLLRRPQYRTAFEAMLRNAGSVPAWVKRYGATLNGPSQAARDLKADGDTFIVADVCQVHDCGDHKLLVVFAPDGQQAWGYLYESGSTRWLGYPSPAVRRGVERIGRELF